MVLPRRLFCVTQDHEMDMRAADLVGSTRDKYLWGYNPESEIVFFIKGWFLRPNPKAPNPRSPISV